LSDRSANGSFSSLMDLVERVEPNARSFSSLAYSGALDSFGSRLGVSTAIPEILKLHRKKKKKLEAGQDSLFDLDDNYDVGVSEFDNIELLHNEYNSLGLYISGHPLDSYVDHTTGEAVADLLSLSEGDKVSVLVLLNDIKVKQTKSGRKMAVLSVQDRSGLAECVGFPKQFSFVEDLSDGDIGILSVRVGSDFNDQKNFVFDSFDLLGSSAVEESEVADFKVFLPHGFANDDDFVKALKRLLVSHYGWTPVSLHLSKSTVLKLPRSFSVNLDDDLLSAISNLFKDYASR